MSKLKHILTIILIGYIGFVQAQYTTIPDPIFEAFLIDQEFDDVMDGQVLTANINNRISLQINETDPIFPIEDLTGIEDFTSLEFLIINVTNVTLIDLGDLVNLISLGLVMNTNLELIDISGCSNLQDISFSNNNLIALDASQNTNITTFFITDTSISELDLRNGANENIELFGTIGCPSLTCILVDDAEFSTANWTNIDSTTTFVETEAECEALSIEEVTTFNFSIYPNPTSQFFEIISNQQIKQIEIVDLSGKVVKFFEQGLEKYPVSDLSVGIYIVNIQTDLGKSSQKLIVK